MQKEKTAEEALGAVANLSHMEKKLLQGLVNGRSFLSLAAGAFSASEAERLKRRLMEKLGARTMADAVRIGLEAEIDELLR